MSRAQSPPARPKPERPTAETASTPNKPKPDRPTPEAPSAPNPPPGLPTITFPPELPVSARRQDIAAAIAKHQVVIVSGETGSGKTTQIPKILLQMGRGQRGLIGHTQPRRIAARSVAERISQELGTELGGLVGYQMRFADHTSPATKVKVMTDGILLAQIQRDPKLRTYDTIIIDEAHERSLNIDFLLGYLSNLLPQRPDLKLIITSATIDSELFARHFGTAKRPAPVITVTGRTYPVELRYRPPAGEHHPSPINLAPANPKRPPSPKRSKTAASRADQTAPSSQHHRLMPSEDQPAAIVAAARELMAHGPGDILVFCSGEREIKDAAEALTRAFGAAKVSGAAQLPAQQALDAGSRTAAPQPPQLAAQLAPDAGSRTSPDQAAQTAAGLTSGANARPGSPGVEVLPLYSRLSAAEQHRIFEPHQRRRIVVATNVAETSLTVPGVHYVIDPGTARISRYSKTTKVQRLPIEPISQASANQRAGRCGRIAKGVCIRLYSEADFQTRPEYTEPEILRTSLASVILQMIAVGVAHSPQDVANFPFVQKPEARNVQDGVRTLEELGAIAQEGGRTKLTTIGRQLAQLPIDPRLGRMMVAAGPLGVTKEVTVLAAALSIQDPRERPAEFATQADQCHARFKDPSSDFLGLLKLWEYLRQARQDRSSSAFRRLVRAEYLNYLRVREWQDLVAELRRSLKDSGQRGTRADRGKHQARDHAIDDHFDAAAIHQAVLTGLVSHIGLQRATTVGTTGRDQDTRRPGRVPRAVRNDYIGPRGANFAIFPGSALFQQPPDWLMAAELVETSRLWARTCAKIDPEWVEQVAPHLARPTYHSPRWSAKRGAAVITEKVLVYGLPVVAGRTVQLARVDQLMARELFIRHALVEGDWQTQHQFWADNQRLLDKLEQASARTARGPASIHDEDLFSFYDARLPAQVVSVAHFDRWWSRAVRRRPDLLTLDEASLTQADQPLGDAFPDLWLQGGFELPVTYRHAPGTADDGVTVHLRVDLANQVVAAGFDWQVPGLRTDLVAALIKALPKRDRAMLLPAADTARQAVLALGSPSDWVLPNGRVRPLTQALTEVFQALRGVYLPPEAWSQVTVPDHLLIRYVVEDSKGRVMAAGRDLTQVVAEATPGVRHAIEQVVVATQQAKAQPKAAGPAVLSWAGTRDKVTTWDFGDLPNEVTGQVDGQTVRGYPSLMVEGNRVALRLATDRTHQRSWMPPAVGQLLLGELALPPARLTSRLQPEQALALAASNYANSDALVLDAQAAVVQASLANQGVPWTAQGYQALKAALRQSLEDQVHPVLITVGELLTMGRGLQVRAAKATALDVLNTVVDIRDHLDSLLAAGWVSRAGLSRLGDLRRYLQAVAYRLDRLGQNRGLEERGLLAVDQAKRALLSARAALPPGAVEPAELAEVDWMIEELRVSLFAQQLGTAYPVSEKRVIKAIAAAQAA